MNKSRLTTLLSALIVPAMLLPGVQAMADESAAAAESDSPVITQEEVVTRAAPEEMMVRLPDPGRFAAQDFDAIINSTIPMTPEQIRDLNRIMDAQQRAAAEPVRSTTPRSRQEIVDIAPGSKMPVISVNKGMVSTLVFLDRYGEPWPVSYFKDGDSRNFTVESAMYDADREDVEGMTNALTVVTNSYYEGNLTVFLKGMVSPIVVHLKPGGDVTDVRVDLRVNMMGPASAKTVSQMAARGGDLPEYDSLMLSLLGGVPPKGYSYKVLDGRLGDAFYGDGRLFIRTHYKIPSSKNMTKSADGTILYEVEDTSVVLMIVDGQPRRVRVK